MKPVLQGEISRLGPVYETAPGAFFAPAKSSIRQVGVLSPWARANLVPVQRLASDGIDASEGLKALEKRGGSTKHVYHPGKLRIGDPRKQLKDKRVLMVDDQAIILNLVASCLKKWGMDITMTTSSPEALRLLQEGPYHLLITDLVMPELDGVELMNRLLPTGHFLPTLVLSGSQGKRAAAVLRDGLDEGRMRRLNLPLSYMLKEDDRFEERLLDRLLYLCGCKDFSASEVAGTLPLFRETIVSDAVPTHVSENTERKRLIAQLVDEFIDGRFAFRVKIDVFVQALQSHLAKQADEVLDMILEAILSYQGKRFSSRHEILVLNDDVGWHGFKGEVTAIRAVFSSLLFIMGRRKTYAPPRPELIQDLGALSEQLMRMAFDIYNLAMMDSAWEVSDVLEEVRISLKRKQFLECDVPVESGPALKLPSRMATVIIDQLFSNARQSTASVGPAPILRTRLADRAQLAQAMLLSPTNLPLPVQARDSEKYIYIGVINKGDPIPEDVRTRMLSGQRFTTKQFGSGLGLTVVHEMLKATGGFLAVESHEGNIEVGVFIPLEGNLA